MSSHYTIVQYVPDPTAEERVNFGVMVWDKERIRSQFLVDWRRVRAFGREDIGFLRDFAKSATEMTSDQPNLPELGQEFDHKHLKKLIGDWSYSIQFTEPRGSIKSAANLLEDVADAFLREPAQPAGRQRRRTKKAAVSIAHKSLFAAVQERTADEAEEIVRRNETIEGKHDRHRFDVVLANGRLFGAVHAMSFEIHESEHLEKEVESTAWTLDDVRKRHRVLPLGVFVLPPSIPGRSPLYSRAIKIFKELHAEVITERKMDAWARQ